VTAAPSLSLLRHTHWLRRQFWSHNVTECWLSIQISRSVHSGEAPATAQTLWTIDRKQPNYGCMRHVVDYAVSRLQYERGF
jgi:hypothetical protein